MTPPQTRYAKSGDLSIAYQVVGDGPLDLVFVPALTTHVELDWDDPPWASFLEGLASFSRLILFDRRGMGLSDRISGVPTLEERIDDLRAVLDAVGCGRVALFGSGDAGAMLALFAATYPDRVMALVLFGVPPRLTRAPNYPWGFDAEEARRWIEEPMQRYSDPAYVKDMVRRMSPEGARDEAQLEWYARLWRLSYGSPGAVGAYRRMTLGVDIRDILPTICAPTLVVQRRDERFVPQEVARYVAERIPAPSMRNCRATAGSPDSAARRRCWTP